MNKKMIVAIAVPVLLLAAACSSTAGFANIENDWKNPEWKGGKAKRVLIVALVADPGTREDVEDEFVIQMRAKDIRAFASRQFIPTFKDVSRETVKEIMTRERIDAVITVRTVGLETGDHSYASDWFAQSNLTYYNSFYNYWDTASIGVFTMVTPGSSTTGYQQLKIETNVYSIADGGTLVYSGLTEATTSRRMGEATQGFVEVMTKRLKRYGLL